MPGYVRELCINKSNQSYIIYDAENNNNIVGKLNPREAYVVEGGQGDYLWIDFLSSNGEWKSVCINTYEHPLPNQFDYGYPVDNICTEYPYGTVEIDGKTFKTFKMRSRQNIYRADGTLWGAVAAGCLVATNSPSVGSEQTHLKLINYVQSSKGKWVQVKGANYEHGFVDSGIRSASGYSKIPFYGSW